MHERLRWEAQHAARQTFGATGSSGKPDPLEVLMGWGLGPRARVVARAPPNCQQKRDPRENPSESDLQERTDSAEVAVPALCIPTCV